MCLGWWIIRRTRFFCSRRCRPEVVLEARGEAQGSRYDAFANAPLTEGFLSTGTIAALKDELVFERAVQSYLCPEYVGHKGGIGKGLWQRPQRIADLQGPLQCKDVDRTPELRRDLRARLARPEGGRTARDRGSARPPGHPRRFMAATDLLCRTD